MFERGLVWFRQDLRIHDNTALYEASKQCKEIVPVFILNHQTTEPRLSPDKRLGFLYAHLEKLSAGLNNLGSYLIVDAGKQEDMIQHYLEKYGCDALFYNRSYGPGHDTRDEHIYAYCQKQHIETKTYDDYLLLHPSQVPPRKVYTPFYKKRLPIVQEKMAQREALQVSSLQSPVCTSPLLDNQQDFFGNKKHVYRPVWNNIAILNTKDLSNYDETRNIPSLDGTTRLSPYLRFGALSPRVAYDYFSRRPNAGHEIIIKELARREFRQHIAYNFPYSVAQGFQAKRQYIQWENNTQWLQARKEGRTGYPLVDAGMRQLREENRMHNRVRMVVASFLTKDLLIDRRRGEQHFADYLLDHDRNVNVGNRQWSASVGADPKPLRIFNPILQSKRFDPDCTYILKYVPELAGQETKAIHDPIKYELDYTAPIVDHYVWSKEAKRRYNASKERYQNSL